SHVIAIFPSDVRFRLLISHVIALFLSDVRFRLSRHLSLFVEIIKCEFHLVIQFEYPQIQQGHLCKEQHIVSQTVDAPCYIDRICMQAVDHIIEWDQDQKVVQCSRQRHQQIDYRHEQNEYDEHYDIKSVVRRIRQ